MDLSPFGLPPVTARQRTLFQAVAVSGFGFFTNADVTCRLMPAPSNTGIVFVRTDLPGRPRIPATIDFAVDRHRRTALEHQGASVELTEHLLAALAGLCIDNCVIEINGPEPPGGDGSAWHFVLPILEAGVVEQRSPARVLKITEPVAGEVTGDPTASTSASPDSAYRIRYSLDYGSGSPILPQTAEYAITPATFVAEIATSRTFILEAEIAALKAHGYGKKVSVSDLLVFGTNGPIGNELRSDNECARHKLLDCIGDFALAGARLCGSFSAFKSGHAANRQLIRALHQRWQTAKAA